MKLITCGQNFVNLVSYEGYGRVYRLTARILCSPIKNSTYYVKAWRLYLLAFVLICNELTHSFIYG